MKKLLIPKDQFVFLINHAKKIFVEIGKIEESITSLIDDHCPVLKIDRVMDEFIDFIVQQTFDNESKYISTIAWFLFEYNIYDDNTIELSNGDEVVINSIEDLYDFLVKSYNMI